MRVVRLHSNGGEFRYASGQSVEVPDRKFSIHTTNHRLELITWKVSFVAERSDVGQLSQLVSCMPPEDEVSEEQAVAYQWQVRKQIQVHYTVY
jgi:hypothetical protein